MYKSLFFVVLFIPFMVLGQGPMDVYRYSQGPLKGDARYLGMGGAFSPLGGNMSSIKDNPAGLGVFLNNSVELSLGGDIISSYADDGREPLLSAQGYVPNLGLVIISRPKESSWKAINFSFSHDRINNWNSSTRISYNNKTSSLADYFAEQATGIPEQAFAVDYNTEGIPELPFTSYLAYQTYLISPYPDDSTAYYTEVGVSPVDQVINIEKEGLSKQNTFAVAGNLNNKLYLGVNLGFLTADYDVRVTHSEKIDNDTLNLQSFTYNTNLKTRGNTGVNVGLGFIFRVNKNLRISGHFNSGTRMKIQDQYNTSLKTVFNDTLGELQMRSPDALFNYKVKVPMSFGGGIAYVFGKSGVFSVEYSQRNLQRAALIPYTGFQATEDEKAVDFSQENKEIKSILEVQHTIKAGGEVKLGNYAFRVGGQYRTLGIKDGLTRGRDYLTYSAGLGYMIGYWRFDVGGAWTKETGSFIPYEVGFTDVPEFQTSTSRLSLIAGVALNF